MTKKFKKWNDLNQFHEVKRNLNYPRCYNALRDNDMKLTFGLKVKLHGTNACVRIEEDGKVVPQKRSSDIGYQEKMDGAVFKDNAGFARWVESNESFFGDLAKADRTRYIYGEWAGPGVQKGVACSDTENKVFYVFALDEVTESDTIRYYEPSEIEELLGEHTPDDVVVIPWFGNIDIDFEDANETKTALLKLNKDVEKIGEVDPLIKELFDIEGNGEGLVAYPLLGREKGRYYGDEEYFSWFNFKAKSEAHRVNKTKTAVQFDPDKFANVQKFADFYVTENRLLQGLKEGVNEELDMKRTSDFIGWVVRDIYKESTSEREANPDLDWRACSKTCSSRAVMWYKKRVMGL